MEQSLGADEKGTTGNLRRGPFKADDAKIGSRFGYFIAAIFNGILLIVANNLLEWDLLPFLTEAFNDALPAINLSLWITLLVNVARIFYPAGWFVALTELASLVFSLLATIRLWRVFPFDFDDYWSGWDFVAKAVLIVAMIGTAIAMLVQVFKLIGRVGARASTP